VRLSDNELMFLIQASENANIKGKDAKLVAPIIDKLVKEFEKKVKQDGAVEKNIS